MSDVAPLHPQQLAAYFALMEIGNLLHHAVEQQLRTDGGISYVQFQVLATLDGQPDHRSRMTDIADRLVHSRSGLTYQATQLEKAGLITREPAPDDERATVLTLTEAGKSLLDKVMPAHINLVREQVFASVNEPDTAILARTLSGIRDSLRAAPPRSARRPSSRP